MWRIHVEKSFYKIKLFVESNGIRANAFWVGFLKRYLKILSSRALHFFKKGYCLDRWVKEVRYEAYKSKGCQIFKKKKKVHNIQCSEDKKDNQLE